MLQRRRVLFFLIIGLAIFVTLGALAAERLNIYTLPSRAVAQVPITVAVSPSVIEWAERAASDFNRSNQDAQISIVSANGLVAVDTFARLAPEERPHAWIAESTFVSAIAQDSGMTFIPYASSLAASELVWGGFGSRADALGTLDWQTIHDAATASGWSALNGDANWGFFKLTIASPTNSAEGLAALLTAAATYHDTAQVTRSHVTDQAFLAWLQETVDSVPNFNTLGPNPAEALATRGPSVGDVGFLAAVNWFAVADDLNKWETFVTSEPHYTMELDYPYLIRANLTSEEQAMVSRFGDYLARQSEQLSNAGFRTQQSSSSSGPNAVVIEADDEAVLALLRWADREGIGQ